MVRERYRLEVEPVLADARSLGGLVADAHVVIAAAKAGVEVLPASALAAGRELLVAADVNAVPPAGVAGVGVMDDGVPLGAASGKAQGIGALAIGNVKYQVERGMFEQMLGAEKAVYLDFRQAFAQARELVRERKS
jgi:methylene-tetrahydromethanopterin dehydrogenase